MVYDECYFVNDNSTALFSRHKKGLDPSMATMSAETHFGLFNIFNTQNIHRGIYEEKKTNKWNDPYSILGLLSHSNKWSSSTLSYLSIADPLIKGVALLHYYYQKHK